MCSKKLPYTSAERELLVALVRERPIIEDKRTHAQNIELKKKAWDELTVAYNAQSYVTPRNNVQLKRCWENIKTQRKKELSQESMSMRRTGGGPPEGGPASSVVDAICPFINLTVPGVIDSNSIEISEDLKLYKVDNILDNKTQNDMNMDANMLEVDKNIPSNPKKRKEISTTSTGFKKFASEVEIRIKRSTINIKQDAELHELRLKRETQLIKREENLIEYEKSFHNLQLEKIKIEIQLLKKQLDS